MHERHPLKSLIEQFMILPGIGEKTAERLAFFILTKPLKDVQCFSETLIKCRTEIQYCRSCYLISQDQLCFICSDTKRDFTQLCVVAQSQDVFAIERTLSYKGCYHVLGGLLSPMDGVYPDVLRFKELATRLGDSEFKEVVLAIDASVEGEATFLYLQDFLASFSGLYVSRLAYGLPVGADIHYTDELTLQKALVGRLGV